MTGEVVVVVPYVGTKVLLQLRDLKANIAFPGHWGFFGGSIQAGEAPEAAALREICEEIGFLPQKLHYIGREAISDLDGLISYAFACPLEIPFDEIVLAEGADAALADLEEIRSKQIFSPKLGRSLPLANTRYIPDTVNRIMLWIMKS